MIEKEKCYQADDLMLITNIDANIAAKPSKNILVKDLETEIMIIVNHQE